MPLFCCSEMTDDLTEGYTEEESYTDDESQDYSDESGAGVSDLLDEAMDDTVTTETESEAQPVAPPRRAVARQPSPRRAVARQPSARPMSYHPGSSSSSKVKYVTEDYIVFYGRNWP